jgi:hypothetical protein
MFPLELGSLMTQDVTVRLDNRVRLMSAMLAATDWPIRAQEKLKHGSHAHSRATRKFLEPMRSHPAAQTLQHLLDEGAPAEAIFSYALQLNWPSLEISKAPSWAPAQWPAQIHDFYLRSNVAQWWKDEEVHWQAAINQSERMFKGISFKPSFKPFFGDIQEKLVFIPNISFPTEREVAIWLNGELVCIAPPRLAWGESPPWPFDEDPAYIYRSALSQYGKLLMHNYLRSNAEKLAAVSDTPLPVSEQFRAKFPTWNEQFTILFVAALSCAFLTEKLGKKEADAYILLEKKMNGMTSLPGMISVLKRYLNEFNSGRYKGLDDFLPIFPKQFRVAAKIVSL